MCATSASQHYLASSPKHAIPRSGLSGSLHWPSLAVACHAEGVLVDCISEQALAGVEVTGVRDLDSGLDTAQAQGRSRLPWQKGDLMLTLTLDNVHSLTLRASGTEPKLKYYLEVGCCQAER